MADTDDGWQPPSNPTFTPVPDLAEDEFMEIEADLGARKVVLRTGDEIRILMTTINFGGIKFRPERPIWIKIRLTS